MTVALCIDDRGGMLFNKRRQSRDRVLVEELVRFAESEGARILISPFSKLLFENFPNAVQIDDRFLENAELGDICFVENLQLASSEDRIERIILYRWNRAYPGDMFFDIKLDRSWRLASAEDFAGSSHEKITKEIYVK